MWLYYPGHAGMRDNEGADTLASTAPSSGRKKTMDIKEIVYKICERVHDRSIKISLGATIRAFTIPFISGA